MRLKSSRIVIAAVLGLAAAIAPTTHARAQEQWTPPALELTSATCNVDGEWELAWSLTDTTDAVGDIDDYTYTVTEVITQIGSDSGPWEDAVLDGTLQVGATLPRTGEGSLTGIQTVPGDTDQVKLKAQSDRTVSGGKKEGRGLKNALQHALELGNCAAPIPPEPEDLPETDYGVGIAIVDGVDPEPEEEDVEAEWIVHIEVPAGVVDSTVGYTIFAETDPVPGDATDPDTVETGEVGVGLSTFRLPITGPLEEPEDFTLQLAVEGSTPLLLEVELPVEDPGTDPSPSPSTDPEPAPALPTLPTTGLPLAVVAGLALTLTAAGAVAINRGKARNRNV